MWGEHLWQRLSLTLAQGQADLVPEAVSVAQSSSIGAKGRKVSVEWSSKDCQLCVSLH